MQFTGLTDRNGKDVYEGDVVTYGSTYDADRYDRHAEAGRRLGAIEWQPFRACWCIARPHYNHDLWQNVQNGGWCEVIGNIYENPELLEPAASDSNSDAATSKG